jgi:O-antigen ligase
MQEYGLYLGIVGLILAAYVLVKGILAAIQKRRDPGSSSLLPLPAYGIIASVILTYGLGFLKAKLPWLESQPFWVYRIIFPGTTLLFPAIIYIISRRSPSE